MSSEENFKHNFICSIITLLTMYVCVYIYICNIYRVLPRNFLRRQALFFAPPHAPPLCEAPPS